MPEVVSKYPDVTLKVLKGAGIKCGEGIPPKILTACPPEKFCSLPTGEMCVYGLNEIEQMTQISPAEIAQVVPTPRASLFSLEVILVLAVVFIVAIVLGFLIGRRGRPRRELS